MEQFAGQSVAYVDHGGGDYLFFGKELDDVGAWLGFQVAFQHVVVAVEVGFEVGVGFGIIFAVKNVINYL